VEVGRGEEGREAVEGGEGQVAVAGQGVGGGVQEGGDEECEDDGLCAAEVVDYSV
jgi:hypothetical protein